MVKHCTLLERLTIWCCSNLRWEVSSTTIFFISIIPVSKSFLYWKCEDLKSIGALDGPHHHHHHHHHHPPCLNTLDTSSCPNFISFQAEEGLRATNWTLLQLSSCESLKSLPEQMHSLFPSLVDLSIIHCPKLKSFPKQDEYLLPSSLTYLRIWNLPYLMHLNGKGFQSLTILRELHIQRCSKLQSILANKLPDSLSCLFISDCPLLKKRCKKEKGKDWPKISHIPVIGNHDEITLWSTRLRSNPPQLRRRLRLEENKEFSSKGNLYIDSEDAEKAYSRNEEKEENESDASHFSVENQH
ncbi:hypothetical protein PTKIN_Ptkin16aG0107300 [Pterospermum kingtungense]